MTVTGHRTPQRTITENGRIVDLLFFTGAERTSDLSAVVLVGHSREPIPRILFADTALA